MRPQYAAERDWPEVKALLSALSLLVEGIYEHITQYICNTSCPAITPASWAALAWTGMGQRACYVYLPSLSARGSPGLASC